METFTNRLFESPVKAGAVTLCIATVGYGIVRGLRGWALDLKGPRPPPGPPKRFLIKNLLQFPQDHFYEKFCEWEKQYGDIISVELPGMPMVVLNSYEVAQEFLAKRPNTTAGRKTGYMMLEIMGWRWSTTFIQPGTHHSNQRRMLRRGIGPQRVASHNSKIEENVSRLMLTLQDFEGNPHSTLLKAVGLTVIEITYGKKMLVSMGKELSSWNTEALEIINNTFFNFWLVDVFHFLRFVPSWMPGAVFKRIGLRSSWLSDRIRYVPFKTAIELHKSGDIGHSIAADLLDEFGPNEDVRDALAVLYGAGADTTSSTIHAFLHAIFLFPEVLEKVYREILTVTEGTRLPRIEDRPRLPYTEAVWKEAFRWNCTLPVGVPHVNTSDEIVNGYKVKAGTMIHVNTGFMMMNPKVWGDPHNFRPERFLSPDADRLPNPLVLIFGFGMRVCPGMYLADRTGFHIAAMTAALFDLVPLAGRTRPEPGSVKYTDTAFRLPIGFECHFTPRNETCLQLLRSIPLEE